MKSCCCCSSTPEESPGFELPPLPDYLLETAKVKTTDGNVYGRKYWNKAYENETFFAFLGIPYAEPPIGDLRFANPRPRQTTFTFNNSFNAFGERPLSLQLNLIDNEQKIVGDEDCLYLNIYCPKYPNKGNKLPVLVFFHAGGHMVGSYHFSTYTPWNMMHENIIFVTVGYRLNIFGFLNMNTASCTGNMGLKDQVLALRWIYNNIKQFGGNKENITISGASSGAADVNFHLISAQSKGLFHKAILQSGNIYCPWGFSDHNIELGYRIVSLLGSPCNTPEKVLQELKRQPAENLIKLCNRVVADEKSKRPFAARSFFGPTLETVINTETFIPSRPEYMMQCAIPVPIIMGINGAEGRLIYQTTRGFSQTTGNTKSSIEHILQDHFQWGVEESSSAASSFKKFYFQSQEEIIYGEPTDSTEIEITPDGNVLWNERDVTQAAINIYTDIFFHRMFEAVEHIFKADNPPPVYIYEFDFNGSYNISNYMHKMDFDAVAGACHGDEIAYLHPPKTLFLDASLTYRECSIKNHLCSMWANFMRDGVPRSSYHDRLIWEPHTKSKPFYLRIHNNYPYLSLIPKSIRADSFEFMLNEIEKSLAYPGTFSYSTTKRRKSVFKQKTVSFSSEVSSETLQPKPGTSKFDDLPTPTSLEQQDSPPVLTSDEYTSQSLPGSSTDSSKEEHTSEILPGPSTELFEKENILKPSPDLAAELPKEECISKPFTPPPTELATEEITFTSLLPFIESSEEESNHKPFPGPSTKSSEEKRGTTRSPVSTPILKVIPCEYQQVVDPSEVKPAPSASEFVSKVTTRETIQHPPSSKVKLAPDIYLSPSVLSPESSSSAPIAYEYLEESSQTVSSPGSGTPRSPSLELVFDIPGTESQSTEQAAQQSNSK